MESHPPTENIFYRVETGFNRRFLLWDGYFAYRLSNPADHFDYLVKKLIYNHGHSDAKKQKAVIQRLMTNGLDFDQAGEIIETAAEELSFVNTRGEYVWYEQNEDLLIYITEDSEIDLNNVGPMLHHLTPPDLREKYGIISTRR
jgi:uncharacterized protein YoaH (UPF0181 family)